MLRTFQMLILKRRSPLTRLPRMQRLQLVQLQVDISTVLWVHFDIALD